MINADASERFMSAPWLDSTDRKIKQELLGALAEERAGMMALPARRRRRVENVRREA